MKSDRQVVPVPLMRRLAQDIGWLTRSRYSMRGLLGVDVTRPRQLIREHQEKTGEKISFTAFLTACVAKAVDADKSVHSVEVGFLAIALALACFTSMIATISTSLPIQGFCSPGTLCVLSIHPNLINVMQFSDINIFFSV